MFLDKLTKFFPFLWLHLYFFCIFLKNAPEYIDPSGHFFLFFVFILPNIPNRPHTTKPAHWYIFISLINIVSHTRILHLPSDPSPQTPHCPIRGSPHGGLHLRDAPAGWARLHLSTPGRGGRREGWTLHWKRSQLSE